MPPFLNHQVKFVLKLPLLTKTCNILSWQSYQISTENNQRIYACKTSWTSGWKTQGAGWPQDKDAFSREKRFCDSGVTTLPLLWFLFRAFKGNFGLPPWEKDVCANRFMNKTHHLPSPCWNFHSPQPLLKKVALIKPWLDAGDWVGQAKVLKLCVRQFPQSFVSSEHVCVWPWNPCSEHTSSDAGDLQTPLRALYCQFIVGYGSCIRTVKGTEQWSSSAQCVLDKRRPKYDCTGEGMWSD